MFRRMMLNGTLELAGAAVVLTAATALYFSDGDQSLSRPDSNLRLQLSSDVSRGSPARLSLLSANVTRPLSAPSLFSCRVMADPSKGSVGFDGPAALPNIRVGEVLDVIEANVGPAKSYHYCRRGARRREEEGSGGEEGEVGWMPLNSLQPVDE